MDFEGILIRKCAPVSGQSARGQWSKQDLIFELPGDYNRKLCVSFWGDKVQDAAKINEGEKVTVSCNIESREFNGRWYTEVRAWRVQVANTTPAAQPAESPAAYSGGVPPISAPEYSAPSTSPADDIDDLPF
jgi:hypothetical protein